MNMKLPTQSRQLCSGRAEEALIRVGERAASDCSWAGLATWRFPFRAPIPVGPFPPSPLPSMSDSSQTSQADLSWFLRLSITAFTIFTIFFQNRDLLLANMGTRFSRSRLRLPTISVSVTTTTTVHGWKYISNRIIYVHWESSFLASSF